jgi:hypothetical protein
VSDKAAAGGSDAALRLAGAVACALPLPKPARD